MAFGSKIPGETPIDPSGLKNKSITNRRQLNIAEAENIRHAVVKYLASRPTPKIAPFDFFWLQKLHEEMFGDVWQWAGKIRERDLNLGIHFHQIRGELFSLVEDLPTWSGFGISMAEQAARLHHRAVKIHPFENGNGRWSRLLANIWLKRNQQPITEWPEQSIGNESAIRGEYLTAIKGADRGEYSLLIKMHETYAEKV